LALTWSCPSSLLSLFLHFSSLFFFFSGLAFLFWPAGQSLRTWW
jgi:hypothetical protein